jgi:hypothetical protein
LLGSPYGELILAPQKIYFIDLRQFESNWDQILTKIFQIDKIHVDKIQDRHFIRKKKTLRECSTTSPRAWLHYLPLFAANQQFIRHYLPLFAANRLVIRRYPPLFAAIKCC